MRAWSLSAPTGTGSLRLIEREKPVASGTEVLVRLTAPGVVPFDRAIIDDQNEAYFPRAAMPLQPGNQGAGIVETSGSPRVKPGDRVMFGAFPYGFTNPGSWAEYVIVQPEHLTIIPKAVSDAAAAQAVVAYPTAYFALMDAGFVAGKTVLATAIGGSIGNAAYQLARALGAKKVLSTAGSTEKARVAAKAGFDNVIDLSKQSMEQGALELTGGTGVDIVIDSLGGQILAEATRCLVRYGNLIAIGFSAGRNTTLEIANLIFRRARIQGYGAYTSTPEEWDGAWKIFAELAEAGKVHPLYDRSFPFTEAPRALDYLTNERPFGSISLTM